MQLTNIIARDLPDSWFQLVDACYRNGNDYVIEEGSYEGQLRRELDYVTVRIVDPTVRPLLPDIPPQYGIPNPVEEEYIDNYLPYILTAEKKPGEQYTYGERLFGPTHRLDPLGEYNRKASSQVDEVIAKFSRGFGNNQACMTIAQPSDIHLTDPPCMRQIDCRITVEKDGFTDRARLHFFVYFRSWDLWAGYPANLAALVHLQEYMAVMINDHYHSQDPIRTEVTPGEIVASSKGVHLYQHFWEFARIRLGEEKERGF